MSELFSEQWEPILPRLTAAAKDNSTCNRLVNEQTHVCILLAAPGVIATYTLAPFVITLFYSVDSML